MDENRKIIKVLISICLLFFILVGYLTYFGIFTGPGYVVSSYNRRQQLDEEKILRGAIYDRNGTVLAKSVMQGERQERVYPYGNLYSQVIGYNSGVYGRSLLELTYNNYLLGLDEYSKAIHAFSLSDKAPQSGNGVYTTLDHSLQQLGEKLLKGKKGAIVAVDPKTGEILALVSKPDYDPNEKSLEANWQDMTESSDSPFLPRATRGLYAPGSTYKAVTAALAVENGLEGRKWEDKGKVVIDGKTFSNENGQAYGEIGLAEALAHSSNVIYSQVGVELGEDRLKDMAGRIGMNREIPFDVPVSRSLFPYKQMGETDLAAAGIGQGRLLVSPLHMALIAASFANGGVMMQPTLVSRVVSSKGTVIKENKPAELFRVTDRETAAAVGQMMRQVVEKGTGKKAAVKGIQVAGKTGTAENELSAGQKNKEHSWFIGYAPAEEPSIAVAVLLEYEGRSGGTAAAPIAGKIIGEYLKKKK
jgi:peptidoglycan glycosyltransferase